MADNGIRALAPIVSTPGTSYGTVLTVPAGKEWEIRLLRFVNTGGAAITVSASLGTAGAAELCFNEVIPVPSASAVGAKNVLGPDFIVLPPGSALQARASATARLVVSVMERDL